MRYALRACGGCQEDDDLVAPRLLVDRRDELSRRRVQALNRLHRLLAELIAGGAKKDLTPWQPTALLASVRPRDVAGKTRRRMAAEELADVVAVDVQLKAINKELRDAVRARGSVVQPLPEPACWTLPPHTEPANTAAFPARAGTRRRARGVNVERPTGRRTLTRRTLAKGEESAPDANV